MLQMQSRRPSWRTLNDCRWQGLEISTYGIVLRICKVLENIRRHLSWVYLVQQVITRNEHLVWHGEDHEAILHSSRNTNREMNIPEIHIRMIDKWAAPADMTFLAILMLLLESLSLLSLSIKSWGVEWRFHIQVVETGPLDKEGLKLCCIDT
jgi:hypothetical protein